MNWLNLNEKIVGQEILKEIINDTTVEVISSNFDDIHALLSLSLNILGKSLKIHVCLK